MDRLTRFTPQLQLETLFLLDASGRIRSTREPHPSPGPRFALIRDSTGLAWALRADVPDALAQEVGDLVREEPLAQDPRADPRHAERYAALLGGRPDAGPAFTFPHHLTAPKGVVSIDRLTALNRHFHGWTADEVPDRAPICAVTEGDAAISVCFCARFSEAAAEAGVETAEGFRGRGLAPLVTTAWAAAIQAAGRLPLYSTSWSNSQSLAVARKLGLTMCASDWSLVE